jgi:tryptophanyl-tRNA synthetase
LIDPPEVVERKVKRAVTDTGAEVAYDTVNKPGVSNLLELLAAATGAKDLKALASKYPSYGSLKADTAAALVEMLAPIQRRRAELESDPGHVRAVLADGAAKASAVAKPTWERAAKAVGLLTP